MARTTEDFIRCQLCGQDRPREVLTAYRPIFQCTRCGLVFAQGEPPGNGEPYTEDYYRHGVYADYLKDDRAIRRNAQHWLALAAEQVSGRKLLDVGCATGFFLDTARALGWDGYGLEVSHWAGEYGRSKFGLPIFTGTVGEMPAKWHGFDVVTLWDTIEHLDRPVPVLRGLRAAMQSDSLLLLSTGDYDSLLRKVTGRRWRLFRDPTHNFFFTAASLERLLRHCGFEVLDCRHDGKWVSLAMVLHQAGFPLASTLRDRLLRLEASPCIYVNPRDVMTVIARPRTQVDTPPFGR